MDAQTTEWPATARPGKRIAIEKVGAEEEVLLCTQQLDTAPLLLDLRSGERVSFRTLVWFRTWDADFAFCTG
jgi:hypothetical protein